MRRATTLVVVPLVAVLAAGCGLDGDDPAAWGLVRHVDREGVFAIDYLAPPWEVLPGPRGLRLRISPEVFGYDVAIAVSTHGLDIATVTAEDRIADLQGVEVFVPEDERFDPLAGVELPMDYEPDEPLADVDLSEPFAVAQAELRSLALDNDARIDFDLAPLDNAAGQQGLGYQVVTNHDTFMRIAYYPTRDGVVRVAMVSVFDLATADVDWMFDGFAVDVPVPPAPAGEAPDPGGESSGG